MYMYLQTWLKIIKFILIMAAPGKLLEVQAKANYSTAIAVWWRYVPPVHQSQHIIYEVLYSKESSTIISKSILPGLNTSVILKYIHCTASQQGPILI